MGGQTSSQPSLFEDEYPQTEPILFEQLKRIKTISVLIGTTIEVFELLDLKNESDELNTAQRLKYSKAQPTVERTGEYSESYEVMFLYNNRTHVFSINMSGTETRGSKCISKFNWTYGILQQYGTISEKLSFRVISNEIPIPIAVQESATEDGTQEYMVLDYRTGQYVSLSDCVDQVAGCISGNFRLRRQNREVEDIRQDEDYGDTIPNNDSYAEIKNPIKVLNALKVDITI